MEVLVVVAIIVMLAGAGIYYYTNILSDTKLKDAKIKIQALDQAVQIFYSQNGNWPQSLDDLARPSAGGKRLIKADALTDPWGQRFKYDPSGANNGGEKPDISTSAEGKTIGNW